MSTAKKVTGKINQVLGAVIDVYFPSGHLPRIGSALKATNKFISDKPDNLTMEVAQHLGDNIVRYPVGGKNGRLARFTGKRPF